MNEEYTPFEEWFETFDRDGGELMLYNTIDLEAAYLAGAAAGYTEGAAAMREKCAEVARAAYEAGVMGTLKAYTQKEKPE